MTSRSDYLRDFLNVTAWHNAGYYGERVTIANGEKWDLDSYNPDGLCSCTPIVADSDNSHGEYTARTTHEFAPKARLVQVPFGSSAYAEEAFAYIRDNGIYLMTRSMNSDSVTDANTYMPDLPNVTYFNAAGNDDDDDYAKCIKSDYIFGIGAAYLDSKNVLTKASYSSESDYVDFCGMANVYVSETYRFTGTSCATPALCGVMALVQDMFIDKTGAPLSRDRLYQFMLDCAEDMGDDGHDVETGWGMIILPNPEDVDVWEYQDNSFKPEEFVMAFEDVSEDAYYYDAVEWAVTNCITNGTSDSTFSPEQVCTRAQAVMFLWNSAGQPVVEGVTNPFTDVSDDAYYYNAVLWAVSKGVTSGTSETTFSPDMECSRGTIVTLLWKYAGSPVVECTNPFIDVNTEDWYYDAVLWAVDQDITMGITETTFGPDVMCDRAQIVTFLYRDLA